MLLFLSRGSLPAADWTAMSTKRFTVTAVYPQQSYGLAQGGGKDPVFFHFGNRQKHKDIPLQDPQVGDVLAAELDTDGQGHWHLATWAFPEDFEEAKEHDDDDTPDCDAVHGRVIAAYGGNTEEAQEAMALYPGDFM